ncbi:MAG TPA: glycoside hydrolase family 3 C-terminal domain-containing protein, partial [Steroidobacteraceae bacterium]|nr:glycoside hydrolase family 3 C-terminal domain-containing protein [Steroidobacteraceae bacterium]
PTQLLPMQTPPMQTPMTVQPMRRLARASARVWYAAAEWIEAPIVGLGPALRSSGVRPASIDQAAGRILSQIKRFGLLGRVGSATPATDGRESADQLATNAAIVRRTAEDAAVLLKNDAQALPLQSTDLAGVAMIGPGALQTVAVGQSSEKALGHVEREVSPSSALSALAPQSLTVQGRPEPAAVLTAVADDMSGVAIPPVYLAHTAGARGAVGSQVGSEGGLAPGLERVDAGGASTVDSQLDFTRAHGTELAAGTRASWRGVIRIPKAGRYRLYLQVLGAAASLSIDGAVIARTSALDLHGNVLQPAQDGLLPTVDGLDNVRKALELDAGPHALALQVLGDDSGQAVQVRLAWVTPEERRADYQHAIDVARAARKVVLFAWSRGTPAFALPGDQDQLISDVAGVNPNTIVVLNISEPIAMPWLSHVKAVLLMWYPGDEGGFATADVLLGRVDPGGRLPFTWPRRLQDNVANDPAHPERSSAGVEGKTSYSEGIFIGYRWFDQQRIAPLYPFGYGLSYTQFDYSDLSLRRSADGGLDVSFEVRNSGALAGDEVPQVYLGPPEPAPAGAQFAPRALAQFRRVRLAAGQSQRLRLHVEPRQLQYWSTADGAWRVVGGRRNLYVGASSRDMRLSAPLALPAG